MAPRRRAASSPLSDLIDQPVKKSKSNGKGKHEPTDEFQQVTLPSFVSRWKVDGMGYGGDVYYQPEFIAVDEAQQWYDDLMRLDTYQPTLKIYGRTFPQSRRIAAYSTTSNATLSYSGSAITMHHPFPPVLERIRIRLEEELEVKFNHVMLNRYDDGGVYIGKHSDNLNNLVIASVSLGAERTFIMSPRLPSKTGSRNKSSPFEVGSQSAEQIEKELNGRKNMKWTLGNGSLVVMQGRTQEFWKHEIPKEPKVKKGRISLTFRQLV
ncbi:hypothetical protein IAR55_001486 [Kwoniella newhampshirensis]|uniref:Fe2OG dioxygenase domain-containing protein n=1 Tax=Kwoniella newhampshirensis TaxID=1651941 RepID=A0AAW0Z2E6_9TREE